MLPGKSGIDFLAELRAERRDAIPVVVVSAWQSADDHGRRFAPGPTRSWETLRPEDLASVVETLIAASVVARVIGVSALGAAAIGATLGLFFAANAGSGRRTPTSARAAPSAPPPSTCARDERARPGAAGRRSIRRHLAADGAAPRGVGASGGGARARCGDEHGSRSGGRTRCVARSARTSTTTASPSWDRQVSPAAVRSSDANTESTIRLDPIIADTDAVARNSRRDRGRPQRRGGEARRPGDGRRHRRARAHARAAHPARVLARAVVADPLRQTVDAASAVAAGNFDVRLNDRRRDEFGELAHAFNAMTESLARAEAS